MDIFLLLGIIGMCCLLFTFMMSQAHKMSPDSLMYDLINTIGAFLLVVYGLEARTWPFVVLNSVWGLYSLKDTIVDLLRMKK